MALSSAHKAGKFGRCAERDDPGDILGPGSDATLLAGATKHWRDCGSAPYIERADAFGGVHLVPCEAQQIDGEVVDRDGDLADRLCAIGVYHATGVVDGVGEVPHRLDGSDLVVRKDQGPQTDRTGRKPAQENAGLDIDGEVLQHPAVVVTQVGEWRDGRGVLHG